jgi:HD superfamily phosphohydrolase
LARHPTNGGGGACPGGEYLDRNKHRATYLATGKPAVASQPQNRRYPDHEKVGKLIITKRKDISGPIKKAGFDPAEIASIIAGEHETPAYNQLVHSSLDMDRMDYLVRVRWALAYPMARST